MAMKGYFILARSPELEIYYYIQFSVIPRTILLVRVGIGLTLLQGIQSGFTKSHRQIIFIFKM